MSVLVKGMGMPRCCDECKLLYDCASCMVLEKAIDWETSHERRRNDCPLVDVKEPPVVHARWILHDEITNWDETWECPACGEEFDMLEGTPMDNRYNFCPNCGADMREADNEA